jgi:hypothetical protein
VLNEAGEVIGVVSESDLLAKLALGGGEDGMPGMITGILHQQQAAKARAVTAADLMTSPAATVSPDDTVEHAVRLMYLRRVKRCPAGHQRRRHARRERTAPGVGRRGRRAALTAPPPVTAYSWRSQQQHRVTEFSSWPPGIDSWPL